jgi:hypothetical protein
MADSDTIRTIREEASDVALKLIEARARPIARLTYSLLSVLVLAIGAAVGFGVTISNVTGSQAAEIRAVNKRVDAIETCVLSIQDSAIKMARSVGQIEGMLLHLPAGRK